MVDVTLRTKTPPRNGVGAGLVQIAPETAQSDQRGGARGLVIGLLISLVFWAAVGAGVLALQG
jgi:hypothetical protein